MVMNDHALENRGSFILEGVTLKHKHVAAVCTTSAAKKLGFPCRARKQLSPSYVSQITPIAYMECCSVFHPSL